MLKNVERLLSIKSVDMFVYIYFGGDVILISNWGTSLFKLPTHKDNDNDL